MTDTNYSATVFTVGLIVLSLIASSAAGQGSSQLNEIAKDFSRIDGYVVMEKNGDYIIDMDESKGVAHGDLFSAVGVAEPIIHPKTNEVIGHLNKMQNVLKVYRIRKGFSFARPLSKSSQLSAGTALSRYESMQAYFWDHTAEGRHIWQYLRARLPNLIWKNYTTIPKGSKIPIQKAPINIMAIHFILSSNNLIVVDAEQNQLHKYALRINPDDLMGSSIKTPPSSDMISVEAAPKSAPDHMHLSKPVVDQHKNKDDTVDFSIAKPVGTLPYSTVIADFIGKNSNILLAATDGNDLKIYKVANGLDLLTKTDLFARNQIVSLKWWQPTNSDNLFLSVVEWSDTQPTSRLYKLNDEVLVPFAVRVRSILGTFDLDSDGTPETLLSQQFDPDSFFGYRINMLSLRGKKLESKRHRLDIPLNFTVIGSQFADITGDGKVESIFVRNGILNIFSGKKKLYASPKQMGGTLSVLTYEKDSSFKDFVSTTAYFEVSPVTADLDNDGQLEILAISSNRPRFGAPGFKVDIKDIQFAAIKYKDGRFIKKIQNRYIDNPVQGLFASGERVLYLESVPKTRLRASGASYVHEFKPN